MINRLLKAITKNKETIEIIATNMAADAYKPIVQALNGKQVNIKEFVQSILIIAGAMRFGFVDFDSVEKMVRANFEGAERI